MSDTEQTIARADEAPPALMCVSDGDRRKAVRAGLEQLGYAAQTPADSAEAIDLLRKVAYQVIVVDETYDGATALDNAVLKALNTMAMSVRRYMFVTLLAADVKSLDNATAFARSVNAVVNPNDLAQLAPLLRRAIADNDAFYRVFREVLQAAGKR
jgi:DNA-binding NtrC family response regulator